MNLDFNPNQVLDPAPGEAARMMWERGDLAGAAAWYDKLVAQRPDNPRLLLDAGRLSDELGRMGEATARLRAAAAAARSQPLLKEEAEVALAKAHMHRGAFAEAAGVWWRLTREGADPARAWAGLATCAHFAGHSKLVKRCERRVEAKASRPERRRLLAEMWVHGAGGELELERPRRGAAGTGQSPLVRLLRASSRALRHHAARHPERADAHYHVAVCAEALGELHAAGGAVRRALNINPRYAAARAFEARLSD